MKCPISGELLNASTEALAAIHQVHNALGAPGDYGYSTKEGIALYRLYKSSGPLAEALSLPSGCDNPTLWERDDSLTSTLLSLTSIIVDEAVVATWTDEQCQQAESWVSAVRTALGACEAQGPEMPAFLGPYKCQGCQGEIS